MGTFVLRRTFALLGFLSTACLHPPSEAQVCRLIRWQDSKDSGLRAQATRCLGLALSVAFTSGTRLPRITTKTVSSCEKRQGVCEKKEKYPGEEKGLEPAASCKIPQGCCKVSEQRTGYGIRQWTPIHIATSTCTRTRTLSSTCTGIEEEAPGGAGAAIRHRSDHVCDEHLVQQPQPE